MYKVMVVDDMDIVKREMKRLKLWGEKSGFIISEEAKNGQEALEKLEKSPVDLVITDIKMPKIDGIELLRNIVNKNLCSCVVLLSDFSEFSYARQGIVLGAFDYMAKPVNEDELGVILKRAGDFIANRRKEIERVRKLEETLGEKVGVFFPDADVTRLINLIQDRDLKAFEIAARIVDIIGANLNCDLIKVESVLKSVMLKIVKTLQEKYGWFEKFVDIEEFKNIDYSEYNKFDDIKTSFITAVRKMITTLNTLQCDIHEDGFVRQVCDFILGNIDSELSLKNVSDKMFMNKTYISEAFKQKTRISFVKYLTMVKMERAKIIIIKENLKAYEIAEKIGFRDVEYFGKIFKKYTGMSLTEFRQSGNKKY